MNDDVPPQQEETPQAGVDPLQYARPVMVEPPPALPIEPPRPRVWTVFVVSALGAGLGLVLSTIYLVAVMSSRRAGRFSHEQILQELAQSPGMMFGLLSVTLCSLMLVTLVAAFLSPVCWYRRLRLVSPAMSTGRIGVAATGAVALGTVFTMAYALGLLPRSNTLEPLGQAMAGLSGANLVWGVLVIGVLAGVAEEGLFRGYMQTRFTQRWGASLSIFLTALMFAAYHMDLSQGILALAMGIYLGFVAEWARSIIPAMIGHAANNTIGVLATAGLPEPESPWLLWLLLVVGLVVLWLCLLHLRPAPRLEELAARPLSDESCS